MHIYKKNGFTLVEILVTISIVALLMIISIPSFRNYKYRNDLSRGADLIQSAVYEARNLALAPQTDKADDSGYYVIRFTDESNGNEVAIYEADSEITEFDNMILVKKLDLPSGILIEEGVANFPTDGIFFSIEKQGKIVKPEENSDIVIRHKNINSDNDSKTITVNHVTGQATIE